MSLHPQCGLEVERETMQRLHKSEILVETLPPMYVGCYRVISANPEHDSQHTLQARLLKSGLSIVDTRIFGFAVEVTPAEAASGKRGYETWMTVASGTHSNNGIRIQAFQGGLYAVLTLFNPFTQPDKFISNGWKYLHEWVLHNHNYQSGMHQWLEELLFKPDCQDLKLYHPLTHRVLPPTA